MIGRIKCMTHTVRTAYVDSNLTYVGETIPEEVRYFMMVLCQVNGSAPQIWSIIISVVFSSLIAQGSVTHLVNSFTTKIAQLLGFCYVDCCDMVQSNDDIEATHFKIQLSVS